MQRKVNFGEFLLWLSLLMAGLAALVLVTV